jgi:DNA-binding cell septation regulator SpoVG
MDNITVFNLRAINKGALKAVVSVNLGNGLILHECKIVEKNGEVKAVVPQRSERGMGGVMIYYDIVEFAEKGDWEKVEAEILAYYLSQQK